MLFRSERREVLERAYLWQRLQTLAILLAAAAAVGAWILSLLGRLQGELEDAVPPDVQRTST